MFKNPITLWLKRTIVNKRLEIQYKQRSLKIGYMAIVDKCTFGNYNVIGEYASLSNVEIKDMSYVAPKTSIKNTSIGKYCSIGIGSIIGLGKHPSRKFVSTHPVFYSILKQSQLSFVDKNDFQEFEKIEIGNDVWIGANVIIMDGVKIGDGAIVAAGSVVVKDVPPYAIVGEIPARIIKFRFTEKEIECLLTIRWWEKDIEWLQKNQKYFLDIEEFMKVYSSSKYKNLKEVSKK